MIRVLVATAIGLGIFAAAPAFADAAPARPLHLSNAWQVSLDANGKVVALQDSGKLDAGVRVPLEHAIREWTFEPGRIDGQPAPTQTTLTLDVTFVPKGHDDYRVRIDDARTGGSIDIAKSKAVPRFPPDAARPGLIARVVVKVEYDASGNITEVQTQPDQGVNASQSMRTSALAAVRKWKVEPERVGGHGVAASVLVPICYTVVQDPMQSNKFDCAWTPPGSQSKVDNGSAYALAPAAKLKSDVIGHAL